MKKLACLVLLAVILVGGGCNVAKNTKEAAAQNYIMTSTQTPDSLYYWTVYNYILKTNYVREDSMPNDLASAIWQRTSRDIKENPEKKDSLVYMALTELTKCFDPYTSFFPPKEAEEWSRRYREEESFGGIGATIGYAEKDTINLRILEILDGPAKKAGLCRGDYLLKINNRICRGLKPDSAVKMIRGEIGTQVALTVRRNHTNKTRVIRIVREKIIVPSANYRILSDGSWKIGYIQLRSFDEPAVKRMIDIAFKLKSEKARGVILDLRGNGGGLVISASFIASLFFNGEVCRTRGRTEYSIYPTYDLPVALNDLPIAVLTNKHSASASEILAGALREQVNATLIGEKSYGKGCGQSSFGLGNGAMIKVTTFLWYTPKGINISGKGLEPDIEVKTTIDDYLDRGDAVIKRAIEHLRTEIK